jgi:hypothetical protein
MISANVLVGNLEIRSAMSAENLGLSDFRASLFRSVPQAHAGYSLRLAAMVRAAKARIGRWDTNPAKGFLSTNIPYVRPLSSAALLRTSARGTVRRAA